MRIALGLLTLTALSSPSLAAELLPQPALVHVEISDGKRATDYAIYIAPDGEGMLDVGAGPEVTKVKLRVIRRGPGAAPVLEFEVNHSGANHLGYTARGEIAPPKPGKRVLIARVPQPSGAIDLLLSIAPEGSDGEK